MKKSNKNAGSRISLSGKLFFGIGVAAIITSHTSTIALSQPPQAQALAKEWLEERFSFPVEDIDSIHLDAEGGVFYVDNLVTGPANPRPHAPSSAGATADFSSSVSGLEVTLNDNSSNPDGSIDP